MVVRGEGRCFYILESREVENEVVAGRVCVCILRAFHVPMEDNLNNNNDRPFL